jgi:hypothetical protein
MFTSRHTVYYVIVGLLTTHAILLLDCSRKDFVTVDEVGHVPAGISHWQTGTFGMYRVNPPLGRMIAVLPVLFANPKMDYRNLSDAPGARPEWSVGADFIKDNPDRYLEFIRLARLSTIAWSILGGWLIFSWARQLYGSLGGLVSLTLWCFGPNILAHGHLVTPDIPAAVSGFAACYAFRLFLRTPSWRRAFLCGLLLGIALLTKLTCLLFLGIWPVLWFLHRLSTPHHAANNRSLAVVIGQGFVIVFISIFTLNAAYGFDRTCQPLGNLSFVSRTLAGASSDGAQTYEIGRSGNRFRNSPLAGLIVPFPEDYINGIDVQRRDFERGFPSYLRGELRHRGWWYYYIYALGVKIPIAVWILIFSTVLTTALMHCLRSSLSQLAMLWLPPIVFLSVISSQTGFNHHMRYVIPIFPFVIVSVGRLGLVVQNGTWKSRFIIAMLLVWLVFESVAIHPHYLSYFNEIAGGSDNGHNHLVDSNIDWGQDLLYLKQWIQTHPEAGQIGLAYYNLIDARILGINFDLPPSGATGIFPDDRRYTRSIGPRPGYYAVSVNFLRGVPFCTADGRGGFRRIPSFTYSYFLQFNPIAKAGYSIFIYHITLEDANLFRRQWGLPLLVEETSIQESSP